MPEYSKNHQLATHNLLSDFDDKVARIVSHLPVGLTPLMNLVSFVGSPPVVLASGMAVAITAWVKGMQRIVYAELAAAATLGINTIIKYIVHRQRPDTIYAHSMKIHSYSFPSGHACGSMVFYGLLAYLAYNYLPQPFSIVLDIFLIVLIILVGISRIYLGAHFPSDVLIGWVIGAISLALIIKYINP